MKKFLALLLALAFSLPVVVDARDRRVPIAAGGGGGSLTRDAVGSGINVAVASPGEAGPWTYSHTTSGSDRALVCIVVANGTSALPTITVTYNGVSLSAVSGATGTGGNGRVDMYALPAPASGSNTLQVSSSVDAIIIQANCVSYTGAHQTTPVINGTVDVQASTTPSLTITSAAGQFAVAGGSIPSNNAAQVTPNDSELWEFYGGEYNTIAAAQEAAGAASVTVDWTSTNSATWRIVGGSVQPP